ncbi:MAG: hypothetical protein V3V61_03910 [Gammaproteobacteria bacterium]
MKVKNKHPRNPVIISGIIIPPGKSREVPEHLWKKYGKKVATKEFCDDFLDVPTKHRIPKKATLAAHLTKKDPADSEK